MRTPSMATASAVVFLFGIAGCGTSGDGIGPRPIETLIYVQGPSGSSFTIVDTPYPGMTPELTCGIAAPFTCHEFNGRVFQTPHLFVLENIRQPVQVTIENLEPEFGPDIQVNIYLGTVQRIGGVDGVVAANSSRTISTDRELTLEPLPRGTDTRVEICSPLNDDGNPMLSRSCLMNPNDRFISFRASIGDVKNSNLTDCILSPILDQCRSPTTFFLEEPQETVDAVMNVISGQNPGNQPTAQVRVELYLNNQNVANAIGTQAVVSADL